MAAWASTVSILLLVRDELKLEYSLLDAPDGSRTDIALSKTVK